MGLEKIHSTRKIILTALLIVFILALVYDNLNQRSRAVTAEGLTDSVNDTLRQSRDKLGRQTTVISVLNSGISDFQKINAGNDSTIRELQEMVDKNTTSATIARTETAILMQGETEIVYADTVHDTMRVPLTHLPTYKSTITTEWETAKIEAGPLGIILDLIVRNDYVFEQTFERRGDKKISVLNRKVPIISMKNINPHTATTELRTFTVKPKKKRTGIWFAGGVVAGAFTILFLNR